MLRLAKLWLTCALTLHSVLTETAAVLEDDDAIAVDEDDLDLSSLLLHHHMNRDELMHYFEVEEAALVDTESYQLAYVKKEVASPIEKRDGSSSTHDPHSHSVKLAAFGKEYSVKMRRNTGLLYEGAPVVMSHGEGGGGESEVEVDRGESGCHFLVEDPRLRGGLSNCGRGGKNYKERGFLRDNGKVLDILPLRPRLKHLVRKDDTVHLVKVASEEQLLERWNEVTQTTAKNTFQTVVLKDGEEDQPYELKDFMMPPRNESGDAPADRVAESKPTRPNVIDLRMKRYGGGTHRPITLEIGVFFDCKATNSYLQFFGGEAREVVDLMLSMVNGMQAIFNYPSLGRTVVIVVVYVEMQKKCSMDLAGGEQENMLRNFCKAERKIKEKKKARWDLALLMSGEDMYGQTAGGRKSFATMGLSTVTGVCEEQYSCVVGEVGVTDSSGAPYPSCGFLAVMVMVHEIGHNLGMPHDGEGNSCSREGGIMSPTRGTAGECEWSSCSRTKVNSLDLTCLFDVPPKVAADHNKFGALVGMSVSADDQCKLLMKDRNARVDLEIMGGDLSKVCNAMTCKSNKRYGRQEAGPALPGTNCGGGRRCFEGKCVRRSFDAPPKPPEPPKWSEWKPLGDGECRHNCIEGSTGVRMSHRTCSEFSGCDGPTIKVQVCGGATCPSSNQRSIRDFATLMCVKFKRSSAGLDEALDGEGKMVAYNKRYPKRVCSIHCLAKGSRNYFAPVLEFEKVDLEGYSPYFPDGTKCHSQGGKDFYCLEGACVNPSARGGRSGAVAEEPFLSDQSARPDGGAGKLDPYFFTNEDGSPMGKPAVETGDGESSQFDLNDEIKKWK